MKLITCKALKNERKRKGLTYDEMAFKTGLSKTFYWQIENGKRRLTYSNAIKIARVFSLKPDDLFYEEQKNL